MISHTAQIVIALYCMFGIDLVLEHKKRFLVTVFCLLAWPRMLIFSAIALCSAEVLPIANEYSIAGLARIGILVAILGWVAVINDNIDRSTVR